MCHVTHCNALPHKRATVCAVWKSGNVPCWMVARLGGGGQHSHIYTHTHTHTHTRMHSIQTRTHTHTLSHTHTHIGTCTAWKQSWSKHSIGSFWFETAALRYAFRRCAAVPSPGNTAQVRCRGGITTSDAPKHCFIWTRTSYSCGSRESRGAHWFVVGLYVAAQCNPRGDSTTLTHQTAVCFNM